MDIQVREIDEITVAALQGDLDTSTAPTCEESLTNLIEQGCRKLILNFELLDYISSAGLRVALATAKKLQADGGTLRICCLNETVQEIFEMSGFITILNVTKTEQEAIDAF